MPTQVSTGSALAIKSFSVALFAVTQRNPSLLKNLTGAAPQQSAAEAKLKGQTQPDMPIVRVTDLSKTSGDTVSVDLINIIGGKPIMGDRMAEGKGESLSFSSMDIKIDLTTKGTDAGGKMTQQRTKHNLRSLSMSNLAGWFSRWDTQGCLVHLAGARGSQTGNDWVIPVQSDQDFAEILVNPVKAPSYNRHFVADSTNLIQGGLQLGSIDSTDILRLEHIDALSTMLADMEFKMQPIKVADDPAAADEPMYLFLVTHRVWNNIQTNTANAAWRTFLQNAWNRASYGSKHPLFKGDAGMWSNILIRKMDRAIRFLPGESHQYVAVANRFTGVETAGNINGSLGAGRAVDRSLLLGAQALGNVYGRNQASDYHMTWYERPYNFGRNFEVAADAMNGKSKIQFAIPDGNGNTEPTDHGVLVVDSAVQL
jgi:N4-gp56 family major capsid protein